MIDNWSLPHIHSGSTNLLECIAQASGIQTVNSPLLSVFTTQRFENSDKWNPALYSWSTADFWRRCLSPVWSH